MSTKLLRFLPRFFRGNKDKEKLSGHNKYCQYVEDGIKAGDYVCRVILLDDKETNLAVKPSARANCLLRKVFDHVNLLERDYFGLRFLDQNNQSHWLDSNKTISSQLKGSTSFTLYFVVKFYTADPCKLREEITRYYFFLQIKRDIYDGRLPVTFEELIELAAYILQSELGDYNPKINTDGYVSEFRFIQHQSMEHEQAIAVLHRRLVGQVPAVAEYRFLEKAKWLEMYGVDLHPVKGESNMEYMLGITPAGIILHKNKNKVGNYFCFFFVFQCDEHWYAFESNNKVACKHLWRCCVEHHAFFSGRTERMMKENQRFRDQPEVIRVASKKHQRRSHSDPKISVSCYGDQVAKLPLSTTISPEAIRMPRLRSLPELPGKDSPRSTRSYPWESSSAGGLYTSGKDSPMSTKSDKLKFQVQRRAMSGSDSEHNYKKRYTSNKKGSDNDSEKSSTTRRHRKEMTSNSDSDVSCRRPPLYPSRGGLSSGDNSRPSTVREDTVSPSHSSTTVGGGGVGATADGIQKRRRRRRSKSPNRRPPEELKNHFVYNLIETEDWPEDQLKEIPYTKVETKSQPFRIKHSPKSKHYAKSRSRSCGDKIGSRNPQSSIHGVEEEEEEVEGMGETNDGNLSPYSRHSKETSPPPPAYSSLNEPVSIRKDQVKATSNYRYQTTETVEPSPTITQDPPMSHKTSSSSRHTRSAVPVGTPESRRPRSHNEHVTRISYCSEPGAESDTPGHHSSRHGLESDTPGHHTSRHGVDSDTPGHHSSRHGVESDTPGHHSSRHGVDSDTPGHHSSRRAESDHSGHRHNRHDRSSNWQSPTTTDSPTSGSYTPVHSGRRAYNQHEDSDYGSYTPVHRSRQTHHYSQTDRTREQGGNYRPSHRSRHSDTRSGGSSSHSHQHRSGSHGDREGHSRSRPSSHVDRESHSSSRSRHSRTPEDNDPGRPPMNKDLNLTVVFHEGQTNEEATEL
ncbi:band 4.1-like protein 4 [Octopus bimaculoides]|nr:band 4.1-like protein 4 [Octopus bimaculoides]